MLKRITIRRFYRFVVERRQKTSDIFVFKFSFCLSVHRKNVNRNEYEFNEQNNRQIYWDDIAMFCHFENFKLGIYPMKKGDICEIDGFNELVEIDPSYRNYC